MVQKGAQPGRVQAPRQECWAWSLVCPVQTSNHLPPAPAGGFLSSKLPGLAVSTCHSSVFHLDGAAFSCGILPFPTQGPSSAGLSVDRCPMISPLSRDRLPALEAQMVTLQQAIPSLEPFLPFRRSPVRIDPLPGFQRRAPAEVLVRTHGVVPEAEQAQRAV